MINFFKRLHSVVITDELTGGFCSEDETVRFKVEIYEMGDVFEPIITYLDYFNVELCHPFILEDSEQKLVSKGLYVHEDFLLMHPEPIVGTSEEEVINLLFARFKEHGFYLAD